MNRILSLLVCTAGLSVAMTAAPAAAHAANRTVCASGCQYASIQAAIDAAAPGDVILLRAGETFAEHLILRAKAGSSTAFITIRSDAADAGLPAAGVRLVPEGKAGANVTRAQLPRLIGRTGTYRAIPILRADPGAHHYRLQLLDLDGVNSEGYYQLVEIGVNQASQTLANAPHHIVFDRVYVHGHPQVGLQRGIGVNGRDIDVLDSYFADIFSLDEAQAIAGFNGAGPIRIENNYLEAAAENVMFGGSDPKTPNVVPSDITIRRNHFTKKNAWRNDALATPAAVTATAAAGGFLAAGTHYFKVVAVLTSGGNDVVSAPSVERSVTSAAGGAAALSWGAVANAARYRVYRGTSSNGQSVYVDTTGTSLTYTGSGERSGVPRSTGRKWTVKNLLELKNAQRVTIDGNVFEHTWQAAQNGYAIVFTPRNQEGTAPWSVVRDITFSNNIVRHAAAGMIILGRDDTHTSQPSVNFRLVNNLFEDISQAYGNAGQFLVLTDSPSNVVIDHNTIVNSGTIVLADAGAVSGFVFTNNFSKHNSYGIFGSGCAIGLDSITSYFPGYWFRGNVLAGGAQWPYPAGNFFPAISAFTSSFVDAAGGNYTLVAGSPFRGAGTDGKDIGIDAPVLAAALALAQGTPPPEGGGGSTPILPTGWNGDDIGVVGAVGSSSAAGGTFTVSGAGADVWGTADAFQFAYQELTGDGTIVARVASVGGSAPWTKAGVMIRGGLDPSVAQAFMIVSRGKGLAFQRRKVTGGVSIHTAGAMEVAPTWVKLTRTGNTISAHASADGTAWTLVGSDTFSMAATVLVGLAVSSHTTTATATATFDNLTVTAGTPALPDEWSNGDIGSVGRTGSAAVSAGTFTVKGAGADIWGTSDAFHYVYRTLAGDGQIVARVAGVSGAQAWTKVGVMMRQTLDAGSAQALMLVSTGKGLAFQRRTVTGGTSASTPGGAGVGAGVGASVGASGAPKWVRLVRAGTIVTASVSSDGTAWQEIGSNIFSFTGEIYVGLAVSSHDPAALATGTFDSVSMTP